MSAAGLLALNFCDLFLLITSQISTQFLPNSLELASQENYINSYITRISEVPHHVLIVYQKLYCSGSLIGSRIVVTAASCFIKMTSDTPVIVKVGSLTMTDIGQVIEVLEVKNHEYFGLANDLDNDIALLMLKDHVKFSKNVKKIPLMDEQDNMTRDRTIYNLQVCGWGSTNLNPQYTNQLLCSDMTVINDTKCWNRYKTFLSKANFCAEYDHNFRLSDNGGPAIHRKLLIGVVSYGADKLKKPHVALITNITFFKRWIEVNVQRFLVKYCVPLPTYECNDSSNETDTSSSAQLSLIT